MSYFVLPLRFAVCYDTFSRLPSNTLIVLLKIQATLQNGRNTFGFLNYKKILLWSEFLTNSIILPLNFAIYHYGLHFVFPCSNISLFCTQSRSWRPGIENPYKGLVEWSKLNPEVLQIEVTLFKNERRGQYESKDWVFVLENVSTVNIYIIDGH